MLITDDMEARLIAPCTTHIYSSEQVSTSAVQAFAVTLRVPQARRRDTYLEMHSNPEPVLALGHRTICSRYKGHGNKFHELQATKLFVPQGVALTSPALFIDNKVCLIVE